LKVSPFFLLAPLLILAACSREHKAILIANSADFKTGTSFLDHRDDSAYYYFNKVATSSKDSLEIATAYNYMARIQANAGDYYGAQETLLASLSHLHENKDRDQYCLSSDFDALGSISQNLKDYPAAVMYYDRAIALMRNEGYRAIELNNKGVAYQKEGLYTQAVATYESILNPGKTPTKLYARILTNLAIARWQKDPAYAATQDLHSALQIRSTAKDEWGLNSSYAHLAVYYTNSHPDSALYYASKRYIIASQLESPDDELEALQELIRVSPSRDLKGYFTRYQQLSDSLQTARNAAKNQFALIRYEAQKNKTDNLRLQHDNSQKELQIIRQRIIMYGSISCSLIVLGFGIAYTKNRLRKYQLRTSQRVHDVVANGLYQIITGIEHGDQIEKEPLLDQLEDLYEHSRNISYDVPEKADLNFSRTIHQLLDSFSNPGTKVLITGNDQSLWDKVSDHPKSAIKSTLQELMINMQKHSGAANVIVKFDQDQGHLKIRYMDDGVGFPPDIRFGNGLTNTGNRIKSIGGRITFDKSAPKGLKIELHFPLGK
jgi:tetratricopeptide (TPR) repeat protein